MSHFILFGSFLLFPLCKIKSRISSDTNKKERKKKNMVSNMVGDIFLDNKAMMRDDQRLFGSFDGIISFVDDDRTDNIELQAAVEERKIYWESQEFLLQEILDQYNSTGSKFREQIKRHIDIARNSTYCTCLDKNIRGCCNNCLRRASVNQLCSNGFSAAICTSKWNRTHRIPGGTHEYIEVIASTQGRRKQISFLVELRFWDEFRMAKACDEYKGLINQLPEMYIGKTEHLNAIVRVICSAAKKSTEEQKIHMGPWRKESFMQMKWSASTGKRLLDHSSTVGSSFQPPMATSVEVA